MGRHVTETMRNCVRISPDPRAEELIAELETYLPPADPGPGYLGFAVPLQLRSDGGELRLITTLTSFATATDPAREAVHPQHVSDVLHGLDLLRSFGLAGQSYILSGHSCGACLAFQAILQPARHYGLGSVSEAPCPAAILGLNGLYGLPGLVNGLGASHEHLRDDYEMLLSSAFGTDRSRWRAASPSRFDPAGIAERALKAGRRGSSCWIRVPMISSCR